MAVFPDRIVLKNSTDADAAIRTAIGAGGSDEISLGEVVVGLAAGSVTFYAKDSNGDIQTIGQNDAAVVIVSSTTPTTDNLGNPLSDGNIWFNPTTEVLSIYSSGAWVAVSGGGGGSDAMTTDGDMLFHNGTESQRLPIGGANKILTSVGGRPTWTTLGDSAAAPTVTGVYLDATSDSDTAWTGTLPTGGAGDTMVAVIMYRVGAGGLTAPTGWTYVNAYAASGVFSSTDQQLLLLYVKTRDGSEPATATWTNNSAARIAGCIYNVSGPVNLLAINEGFANSSSDVSVATATGTIPLLHLNFSHAVLASADPSTIAHSGTGVTAVADQGGATSGLRLATSYISTDGVTVTSQCSATGATGGPNHNIFTLAIGEYTTSFGIDKLSDVDTSTTAPTDGDVLVWDSTAPGNWVPQAPATGGGGGTETGRGDGGDFNAGTVDASFVLGVYGGGDFDAGTDDTPVELSGGNEGPDGGAF